MKIKVLLVDDHATVREGLRTMLGNEPDMEVDSAEDGRDALKLARELKPDVVVMDVTMPRLNGIDATAQLKRALPHANVIVLSMHDSVEVVQRAFEAGASGYLLKESTGWEIVDAIRAVRAGRRYLSRKIDAAQLERHAGEQGDPLKRLSRREREVLQLVVEGHTSAEIATMVSLSPKTVDSYRSRLMQKLDVRDLPSLVKLAIRLGLTELK
ncbi:MAG TPA: response regulator transcription factor [Burkholderiales bacterium]|nr:response regulator transcription factor [Burkholderiales bacterium]